MNKTLHTINVLQHEEFGSSVKKSRELEDRSSELINQVKELDNIKAAMSQVRADNYWKSNK